MVLLITIIFESGVLTNTWKTMINNNCTTRISMPKALTYVHIQFLMAYNTYIFTPPLFMMLFPRSVHTATTRHVKLIDHKPANKTHFIPE